MKRIIPRTLLTPAVVAVSVISVIPLLITLYYAFVRYSMLDPSGHPFHGLDNFHFFFTDAAFLPALQNTFTLLFSVMLITVLLGAALGLLINEAFPGRAIVRVLLISPFLVMPAVNALMWKNMLLNPIYGLFAQISIFFGATPVDWLSAHPLVSIIMMVSWQWLPFACLIFMTALQSMDREQLEAARMDGANYLQQLRYLYIPASGTRGIGGADDRDDLPAVGVCRNLYHHGRRAGLRHDHHHVHDLPASTAVLRHRRGFRRRAVRRADR